MYMYIIYLIFSHYKIFYFQIGNVAVFYSIKGKINQHKYHPIYNLPVKYTHVTAYSFFYDNKR